MVALFVFLVAWAVFFFVIQSTPMASLVDPNIVLPGTVRSLSVDKAVALNQLTQLYIAGKEGRQNVTSHVPNPLATGLAMGFERECVRVCRTLEWTTSLGISTSFH